MPAVVTDKCIRCKHMSCIEACIVDCFYEGENMLVINPRECVDCGCCVDLCPIDAIAFDNEPAAQPWLALNAKYSQIWPNVTVNDGQTPPDADEFANVEGKFERYFSDEPGEGKNDGYTCGSSGSGCSHCSKPGPTARIWEGIKALFARRP